MVRLQGQQADILGQGDGDAAGRELQRLVGAQRFFVQPVEIAQGRVVAAAVNGATEVYEVDVLVAFARLVALLDEDRVRGLHLARVGEGQDGRGGNDLRGDARLLLHLAEDGLQRVFVRLDVAAGRHPLLKALVPVEERAVALHDEAGGGEMAPHQAGSFGSDSTSRRANASSWRASGPISSSYRGRSSGQRSTISRTANSSGSERRARRSARGAGEPRPGSSSRALR